MRVIKVSLLIVLIIGTSLVLISCGSDGPSDFVPPIDNFGETCEVMETGWTIPTLTVVDGGVGKDGIPSIDNPRFVAVDDVTGLAEDELVVVVKVGDVIKAYPQRILDQHEIVNDMFGSTPVALTFCPQTGTALAFDRRINDELTTLGVSGLLYNSNLVMYDRSSDTRWAQMTTQAVNGELACDKLEFLQTLELSWGGVKDLFPQALVLSGDTGFDRNYTSPPLSKQTSLNSLPTFPYTPKDERFANYKRVHAIIDTVKVQIYTFDQFSEMLELTIDDANVLISHPEYRLIVSYKTKAKVLQLATDPQSANVIMQDSEGNGYNLFGEVIAGERVGERLEPTFSYMGYWFSLASMFPNPVVFENGQD